MNEEVFCIHEADDISDKAMRVIQDRAWTRLRNQCLENPFDVLAQKMIDKENKFNDLARI